MLEFTLPALGADMDQGRLLEWRVRPGEAVRKGQVVALVDTAKAAVDVEIWQEGTVHELRVQPGETVPVGTVLATLLAPGETAPPPGAEAGAAAAPRPRVSPAARRRAVELGVEPATLTASGAGGVVTLADVERAASPRPVPEPAPDGDRLAEIRRAIAAAMSRSNGRSPTTTCWRPSPWGPPLPGWRRPTPGGPSPPACCRRCCSSRRWPWPCASSRS